MKIKMKIVFSQFMRINESIWATASTYPSHNLTLTLIYYLITTC